VRCGLLTLTVAGLAVLALVLRVPGVATRSLWLDEAWRANIAVAPTWALFWNEVLGAGSGGIGAPLPPLFALLLRGLALGVGRSAAGLRILPLAASVAAVPLAYLVGRRSFGRAAGLMAAACFACYPAAITYGQELKQYSVDVVVVLGLLLLAERVVRRPDDRRAWRVLVLAASLTPGLSYPAALVLPGIALGILAACRTARHVASWVASQALAATAALAWYVGVIGAQRARPLTAVYWAQGFAPREPAALAHWTGAQMLGFAEFTLGRPVWLLALTALAGYFLAPRWLRVTALTAFGAALAAAALRLYPLAASRTSLFLLPFVYLPWSAAIARLGVSGGVAWNRPGRVRRAGTFAVAAALLIVPAAGSLHPTAGLVREETAPLLAWLAAERQPTDRVYVYYGAEPAFRFYHPETDARLTFGGSHRGDSDAYVAELERGLVPGERQWLLFAHVAPTRSGESERDVILGAMRLYGTQIAARETDGASLHLFEVTRAPGSVRHLRLTPDDMRDPDRLRKLLDQ
jgi:hypothetical protein